MPRQVAVNPDSHQATFRTHSHALPMSNRLNHRGAPNPPSIVMEKGTYRTCRDSPSQNPGIFTFQSTKRCSRAQDGSAPESQPRSASLISQEKRLVLLVVFLVFATFCCFGTAYYLFTASRWVPVSSRMGFAFGFVADQPHMHVSLGPHSQPRFPPHNLVSLKWTNRMLEFNPMKSS